MKHLDQQPEVVVAPDERRFERVGAVAATDLGHDAQRAEGGDGRLLALEHLFARGLELDGPAGGSLGRLTDQNRALGRDCLKSAGRVDQVAGDHSLACRADR